MDILLNPHADRGAVNDTADFVYSFPDALQLDSSKNYGMALVNAEIWYAVRNVMAKYNNNKFNYTNTAGTTKTITFPDGIYTLEDICTFVETTVTNNSDSYDNMQMTPNYCTFRFDILLGGGYSIDFTTSDFNKLLGFDSVVVSGNGMHSGTSQPDITVVD